jgi:putative ABC transport system substrate-binding protein
MLVSPVVLVSGVNANLNDEIRETAATIGVQIEILNVSNIQEIDAAFVNLVQKQADALLVRTSPLFIDRAVQIATLAARHAVPTVHFQRQFAAVGGLMSYGANYPDQVRQVGVYVGRILKGEKTGDLPILQPTKFDLVINVTTARAIGLEVPPSLLAIADEVIE